jgi:hypothetical protein
MARHAPTGLCSIRMGLYNWLDCRLCLVESTAGLTRIGRDKSRPYASRIANQSPCWTGEMFVYT